MLLLRLFFLLLVLLLNVALPAQVDTNQIVTTVSFEDGKTDRSYTSNGIKTMRSASQDFETIAEGDTVVHTYRFKNTGIVPLVITDARSNCACTIVKAVPDKVLPGATDSVIVQFNTWGRKGPRNQRVWLRANIEEEVFTINLRGKVIPNNGRRKMPAKPVIELDLREKRSNKDCIWVPFNSLGLDFKLSLYPEDLNQPALVVFKWGSGSRTEEMLYDRYESFTGEEQYYVNHYGRGTFRVEVMFIGGETRDGCFTVQ